MTVSLNKVTLIGNLGADVEVRSLANGGRVANLRVATSETWRDRQTGEPREVVELHHVVIFNENLIKYAEDHASKGATVYLEGKIQTRKWLDHVGVEHRSTEIVMQPLQGDLKILAHPKARDEAGA